MRENNARTLSTVTTGPIQGSAKRYEQVAGFPWMSIPVRRVNLSNGEHFDLYDTSGPYTDETAVIDLPVGLARTRDGWTSSWLMGRSPTRCPTSTRCGQEENPVRRRK